MVKGMSSEEVKQLRDLLDKVYDNMQAMQEDDEGKQEDKQK